MTPTTLIIILECEWDAVCTSVSARPNSPCNFGNSRTRNKLGGGV